MFSQASKQTRMFKAIGFVIALYAISNILGDTFIAFEAATVSTLQTIEAAADVSRAQLLEISAQ